MKHRAIVRKYGGYILCFTLSLFLLLFLTGYTVADSKQSDSFPGTFGPKLIGSEGDVQSRIEKLSEQLTSEPYRTDLYYQIARAYAEQGWQDKAAQYMSHWIKASNSDMLVKDSHAFMIDEKNDKVLVIDTKTKKLVREIEVGWLPKKMAPTPDMAKVYVTNALANSVSLINTGKMAVTKTIKTGRMPWNGKSSPQGDRVYIANLKSDDVSIIDAEKDVVLDTVKVGRGPWGIAISPDGHRLYVSNQDSQEIQVVDTGNYSIVDVINVGANPRDIALAPDDDKKLYAVDKSLVTDEVEIYVVDLAGTQIVGSMSVPAINDPLLARFSSMSFDERLDLMAGLHKSEQEAKKPITKPEMANPLFLAKADEAADSGTRPVAARNKGFREVELPKGGPAPLIAPVLDTYVSIPPATSGKPAPLPEFGPYLPTEEDNPPVTEESPQKGKRVLRIVVVVERDTLWKISMDNYGVANDDIYRAIQEANPAVRNIDRIYVGQKITLPVMEEEKEYVLEIGKPVLVKPNDNLFRIALRNYGTVNDQIYSAILKANPSIRDVTQIEAGQKIMLPDIPGIPSRIET